MEQPEAANENDERQQNRSGKREDICPAGKKLDPERGPALGSDAATAHDAAEKTGPEYWRSLEELAGSDAVPTSSAPRISQRRLRVGRLRLPPWIPQGHGSIPRPGRHDRLRPPLPLEPIVPYVRQPEDVVPGRPMYYATAVTLGGYASPVLVESHLGRPTKIEGNDQHPASLGGTDIFAQASILGLYDPDRSQTGHLDGRCALRGGAFLGAVRGPLSAQKALQGAGIRILTPTISSPTLADQLRNFLKIYPQAKWHVYEPINRDNVLRRR